MIGFAGLSHLGIVSSVVAASKGFEVLAYDPDAERCGNLSRRHLPFYEPGLPELLSDIRGRLRFTASAAELRKCSLLHVALDVGCDDMERSNLADLLGLLETVLNVAPRHSTLLLTSQVPPSATRRWLERIEPTPRPVDSLALYHRVETLVPGQALPRARRPEHVLLGCDEPRRELPAPLAQYLQAFDCPIVKLSCTSPELSRLAIDHYLESTRVSAAAA